jgi:hypothetical protein
MSRGLGRWQRLLLHRVYVHPEVAPSGARYVHTSVHASTPAEYTALQRAARTLLKKGLVRSGSGGCANRLEPLTEPPALSVQNSQDCPLCEHLGGAA